MKQATRRTLMWFIFLTLGLLLQAQPVIKTVYQGPQFTAANHVLETTNGNFLMSGSGSDIDLGTIGCVMLVDPEGNPLWPNITRINLVSSMLHAIELDNSFIVSGNNAFGGLVFKLNKLTGEWTDSTSIGPCEIGARPPVNLFTGNCGNPFIGEHALLRSQDGFIVAGYYPFSTNRAYIARFDENLNMDQSFRNLIDQNISNNILWGTEIIDIERSPVDGDILFFGLVNASSQECGFACSDDVGCTPCNDDIWVLRFDNQVGLEYSTRLIANACESFTDATVTPDNGFAIIGSSTSSSCSQFGPGSVSSNFSNNWFWKLDEQANSEITRVLQTIFQGDIAIFYSGRSIKYDQGFLIGGCLNGGITDQGVLAYYDDNFMTNWSHLHNCISSCFEYSIPTQGNCFITTGYCQNSTSESTRKILVSFDDCQYQCEDALLIPCGEDRDGDTGDEGLEDNISDYSFCPQEGRDGYVGPDITYRITGFASGDNIFVGVRELGQNRAGLDVCVVENCRLSSEELGESEFCQFDDRQGNDPETRITIQNASVESDYYAIVDSRGDVGDYRISISCMDDCSDYPQLVCEQPLDARAMGANNRRICAYYCDEFENPYQDEYTSSEFGASFIAPENGEYTFRLTEISNGNPDLFVLAECSPFSCIGRSQNAGSNEEFITITLAARDTVYLLVDSREGNSRSTLSVECCNDISCGCENALDIRCGFYVEDNNRNGESRLSDYSTCSPEGSAGFNGPEMIYRILSSEFDAFKPTDLFISISDGDDMGNNGGLDVFIVENCNQSSDEESTAACVYGLEREDTTTGTIHISNINPASDYFVIVDSRGVEADFILNISCPEDCDNTGPIECNDTINSRFNNDTNGSSKICSYYHEEDNRHFSRYDGVDLKAPFIPPRDGLYTFRINELSGGNVLDLFILDECNPFSCIGYSVGQNGEEELVELTLSANDTVYVIVDAQGFETASDFTLVIECCEASASQVFADDEQVEATICLGSNDPSILNLFHNGSETARYQFMLTDTFDRIQQEVANPLDAGDLTRGKYRIYGVSFLNELFYDEGSLITQVTGSICAVVSDNFITLCIDSTYQTFIDTTLCFGEGLRVCDTLLTEEGTHQINCFSTSGCDSVIIVSIVIDQAEVEITGALSFCADQSTTLFATPGFSSYLWSTESTEPTAEVFIPGFYSVIVTSESGCLGRDTVEVTSFEDQGIRLIPERTICSGDAIRLVQESFCDDCTCTWAPAIGLDDPISCNPMASPDQLTTYVLSARSADGCEIRDSVTINVVPAVQAEIIASAQTLCRGETLFLEGVGGECEWLLPDGSMDFGCSLTRTPLVDEVYRFVGSSEEFCFDTAQISIRIIEPPSIILIDDTTICEGNVLNLRLDTDCPECVCNWTSTQGLSNPDDCNPTVMPNVSGTFVLNIVKEDVCMVTDSVQVQVDENRSLKTLNDHFVVRRENTSTIQLDSIIVNDTVINTNEKVQLDQVFFEPVIPASLHPEIVISRVADQLEIVVGAVLGLDTFQYVLIDRNCGSRDTGTIQLQIIQNDQVSICNPDEERVGCKVLDGIEDYENNDIAIFDREGTLVHIAQKYLNDWDGRHIQTGERVPTGSYYFVLHLREKTRNIGPNDGGEPPPIKGVITIIRR